MEPEISDQARPAKPSMSHEMVQKMDAYWQAANSSIVRIYLPPHANCLLSVTDHCLRSRNYINVIVAGKQPEKQWLNMDDAIKHCTAGLGIWELAGNDKGSEPDLVMVCAGDVPTLETIAAVQLMREQLPELKIRVINVVDLFALQPRKRTPSRFKR